jgi:beta-N-acetylhexosaminidase
MTPSPRSLEADAGQLLLIGFDGKSMPDAVGSALREGRIGGVILFSRNIESPEQVADVNAAIYEAAAGQPMPFVAVDQEGGRVQRLREPLTRWPPMRRVGDTGDADLSARFGEAIGDELEALGFNLDFAPCIDVFTNPANSVIGDRAFGTTPERVGRMGGAFALGLTQSGMIPCAKHFPGHGDTEVDSHFGLPVVRHDMARIEQVELEPFRMLIRAHVPMIMTAHVLVPALDPELPATLSKLWIEDLLRRKMKYGGVIISDDLEMKAVADHYDVETMVELGLEAGIDVFLVCHTQELWERAFAKLVALGERSERDRDRIALAAGRVRALKKSWIRPWSRPDDLRARLGTAEHRELVGRLGTERS